MVSPADILGAFAEATRVQATGLAGSLLVVCVAVGGLLVVAWVFRAGQEARRGSIPHASRALLLVTAAFSVLVLTLGVFYKW